MAPVKPQYPRKGKGRGTAAGRQPPANRRLQAIEAESDESDDAVDMDALAPPGRQRRERLAFAGDSESEDDGGAEAYGSEDGDEVPVGMGSESDKETDDSADEAEAVRREWLSTIVPFVFKADHAAASLAQERIRGELADIPFDELQRVRQKMGVKKFDATFKASARAAQAEGSSESEDDDDGPKETKSKGGVKMGGTKELPSRVGRDGGVEKLRKGEVKKRTNKKKPAEMSSKQRVSALRQVIKPIRKKARDPRFDDLSGHFNRDLYEKSYSFIDELRQKELADAKKELDSERDPTRKRELQGLVDKLRNEMKTRKEKRESAGIVSERKKMERELVAKGKKPFYLKKGDQRRLELIAKYERLKESGGVDKFLEKRRKKNATKDHRFMPYSRNEK